jgi:hypothetical protein
MWFSTIGLLVAIIAFVFVIELVKSKLGTDDDDDLEFEEQEKSKLPYNRKDYFFTIAERQFFEVLNNVLKNEYLLLSKVRVADLFYFSKHQKNKQSFLNKIQSKHVDFVLCEKNNFKPLLAIELDDSSHSRPDRVKRDDFIDQVFKDSNFPILHIRCSSQYNPEELIGKIKSAI